MKAIGISFAAIPSSGLLSLLKISLSVVVWVPSLCTFVLRVVVRFSEIRVRGVDGFRRGIVQLARAWHREQDGKNEEKEYLHGEVFGPALGL